MGAHKRCVPWAEPHATYLFDEYVIHILVRVDIGRVAWQWHLAVRSLSKELYKIERVAFDVVQQVVVGRLRVVEVLCGAVCAAALIVASSPTCATSSSSMGSTLRCRLAISFCGGYG